MAIEPVIGIGFAPSSLFIQRPQLFGYDAFILLLFVSNRALGFVHHLISAYYPVIGQVNEIVER
ncbi:MAG: hypothetical protein EHM85_13140 [Desulfobacteraceae bacterium]|nr:MAG: hypothetical protein EHM85_13140 [Desulfobacteraceae bacterium]